jgi:hypothetical protein
MGLRWLLLFMIDWPEAIRMFWEGKIAWGYMAVDIQASLCRVTLCF